MTEIIDYVENDPQNDLLVAARELRDRGYFRRVSKKYGLLEDSEDLITDTVMEVLQNLRGSRFEKKGSGLTGYLARAFTTNCIDLLRLKARDKYAIERNKVEFEEAVCPKTPEALDLMVFNEAEKLVRETIENLRGKSKDLVYAVIYNPEPKNRNPGDNSAISRGIKTIKDRLAFFGYL